MSHGNYTAEERVVHKLLGAAYQMTFEEEYDLACETAKTAIQFQERANQRGDTQTADVDDASQPQPVSTDGAGVQHAPVETSGVRTPGAGTKSHEAVVCLLNAHHDGTEWAARRDVTEFQTEAKVADQLYMLVQQYDWIETQTKHGEKRFRVAPDVREDVKVAIFEASKTANGGESA